MSWPEAVLGIAIAFAFAWTISGSLITINIINKTERKDK